MPPKQKSSRKGLVACDCCHCLFDEKDLEMHNSQCLRGVQTLESKCGFLKDGQLFGVLNIVESKGHNINCGRGD